MNAALTFLLHRKWLNSRKLAEKHVSKARQLLSSQDPADVQLALTLLDSALKLSPQWDKAIELKARALLCLRRFKDVASLLHDFIPSFRNHRITATDPEEKEKVRLLDGSPAQLKGKKPSLFRCFSFFPFKSPKMWIGITRKGDKEQWRYIVLGQACCHLGMMEDAMVLLSNGKRAASAAIRKQSNNMREDGFIIDTGSGGDSNLVSYLLGNIKFLLRRRTTALAALDAGLYIEAARHFSKIIDGRRGTPQGFIAECYMHRAEAYRAANRLIDAISDCNRALALNPTCAEALSTRATVYETIGCFADCLHDLEQLKSLYETLLQNHSFQQEISQVHPSSGMDSDFQGCIDFIRGKAIAIRDRYNGHDTVDHYRVLGLSRGCPRTEVERAYLLFSLKLRPDKAAHFIDRCEFVDERDVEVVKTEARSLGLKLFRLIQRAYIGVITAITEEEMSKDSNLRQSDLVMDRTASLGLFWGDPTSSSDGFLSDADAETQSLLGQQEPCFPEEQMWLDAYDDG